MIITTGVAVILALYILGRIGDLRRRIDRLEKRIPPAPVAAVSAPTVAAQPDPTADSEPADPSPAPLPIEVTAPPETMPPAAVTALSDSQATERAAVTKKASLEERLTSRWLVWLGAVAIVLSGVFLIKHAVDNALLSPAMRVGLGLLLAVALTVAGEWLRRRPEHRRFNDALKEDYVPGALTSAGLFIGFASIYGAHAVFDLIGPATAFAGLAAVALVAFTLAAIHAPIVAIIGLLAGFATPLLVKSPDANAWILFSYLALIIAAAYAVVIHRAWDWLAFGATAGGLGWVLMWALGPVDPQDLVVIALFLAGVTGAALYLAQRLAPVEAPKTWELPRGPELNAWIAATGAVVLAVLAALSAQALPFALLFAAPGAAALAYAGRRMERFDGLIVHSATLLFLMLNAWDPPGTLGAFLLAEPFGNGLSWGGSLIASGAASFVHLHLACAAGLAAVGFVLLHGARRPALWAGGSLVGAVAIVATGYARSRYFTFDVVWTLVATGSAALATAAAGTLIRKQARDWQSRLTVGFYAAAAVAGVSFAFAFTFREAWLTVALALQLPALAWIERKLDLKDLRHIAHVLAAIILVRLLFNPYVLSYDAGQSHWVLYGYGIPALAFYAAARLFRPRDAVRTVALLESGALVFALLLVALEIRLWTEGQIAAAQLTLFEASLHSLVWLAAGWWRGRTWLSSRRAIDGWWSATLCGLGVATVVLFQLVGLNPVATHAPVAGYPIFNVLIIAYLLPAVLVTCITRDLSGAIPTSEARIAGFALSAVLALAWLTLETKRVFQGPVMVLEARSDAEYYAYSVAWLAFSFVLLSVGLWRRQAWLRHGALAILILVVCKVFLLDLAALSGLYRVASFLGLGLCLVGIGYLYQRFVFAPASAGRQLAS